MNNSKEMSQNNAMVGMLKSVVLVSLVFLNEGTELGYDRSLLGQFAWSYISSTMLFSSMVA